MFIFYFFFVQPVGWWYTDYLKFKYNIASAPFFCPYHTTYITVRYASYLRFLSGFIFQVPALFSRFRLYFSRFNWVPAFFQVFLYSHLDTWTPDCGPAACLPAAGRRGKPPPFCLHVTRTNHSLTNQPRKKKTKDPHITTLQVDIKSFEDTIIMFYSLIMCFMLIMICDSFFVSNYGRIGYRRKAKQLSIDVTNYAVANELTSKEMNLYEDSFAFLDDIYDLNEHNDKKQVILFRSYCTQKFHLEETVENEITKTLIELKENGEVSSNSKNLKGTWNLDPNNELTVKLVRTFKGRFTEYTTTSLLIGSAEDISSDVVVISGEVYEGSKEEEMGIVGDFVMIPATKNNNPMNKSFKKLAFA